MTVKTDFLIIGGGMAGVSAGAALSENGSVVILEMEDNIGYHSTGRSAAIFIKNYGNAVLRRLNALSEPFLINPEGVADHSLLSPRGEMLVAPEEDLDVLENYLKDSEGVDRLTAKEALELFPILDESKIVAAAIERKAQDIDVDIMLQGYARQLLARGGQIIKGAKVSSLSFDGHIWSANVNGDIYEAPVVINAAGAWADEIAGMAQIQPIGLQPCRRSAAIISIPDEYQTEAYPLKDWPLCANVAERWYAKPEAGKLMVSPADEDIVSPHDAWADDMVLAEGLYRFEEAMKIEVTHVEHNWAGLRNFVKDRTPVVGFDSDNPGFFWLAGQGGYGIQTAPALAALTRDLCCQNSMNIEKELVAALSPARLRIN